MPCLALPLPLPCRSVLAWSALLFWGVWRWEEGGASRALADDVAASNLIPFSLLPIERLRWGWYMGRHDGFGAAFHSVQIRE